MNAMRKKYHYGSLLFAAVLFFALPNFVFAHGELLIRIAAATKKIQTSTNNPASLYLERGELYREDKNWSAADADYAQAAKLGANIAEVDFCRAKMLADSSQLDSANTMFTKVISGNLQHGEAFIGRARVSVKLEKRNAAIADYRSGIALLAAPPAEYFLELAQTWAATNEKEQALIALDEGIKRLGPVALLQTYAFDLELSLNRTEVALVRLDAIIQQAERKETWLARRGDILMASGRTKEARKSFESALAEISKLPRRLQELPHTAKLKNRINTTLTELSNGSFDSKPTERVTLLVNERIPHN
jgi:tetratricopeptide (TPR) repeat protein